MMNAPDGNVNWDYDAAKVLGKGTMGCVFLGIFNDENVAVKRIDRAEFLTTKTGRTNDMDEAPMLIKLDHPNVLKLFFVDTDCYFKYFIMELCEGTLGDYCRGKYTGPVPRDPEALFQMTSGLAYIHSKGFVHRDLKADNVLIRKSGDEAIQLKLSDFGVSKPDRSLSQVKLSGLKGTRHFYSAELLKLADEESGLAFVKGAFNTASDVFALGCLFYCFLTKGKHPFTDHRPHHGLYITVNILEGKYYLNSLRKDQAWSHQVIAGMIQSDPKNRWGLEKVTNVLKPFLHSGTN